jgi:hypothetical protein
VRHRREARLVSKLRGASRTHDLDRACPRESCQAAKGWRCGRWVGGSWTPLKVTHPERQQGGGTDEQVP